MLHCEHLKQGNENDIKQLEGGEYFLCKIVKKAYSHPFKLCNLPQTIVVPSQTDLHVVLDTG